MDGACGEFTLPAGALPELADVHWRPRVGEQSLKRTGRVWMLATAAHTLPLIAAAALLVVLSPLTAPIAFLLLVHAWAIPELYAARGAGVVRPRPRAPEQAERRSLGLLGDLIDHRPRELHARTGLVPERGALGLWLIGEAGALLVRPGGRRAYCYCVRVADPALPSGDAVAHLLLALRTDECGFATVANLTFAGAAWRLRRRLPGPAREALAIAAREA